MMEVEHVHRVLLTGRYVRFMRITSLSIPPSVGMVIDYTSDYFRIDEGILKDGGGIRIESSDWEEDGTQVIFPDSDYQSWLKVLVGKEGWAVLSDVDRKNIYYKEFCIKDTSLKFNIARSKINNLILSFGERLFLFILRQGT